MAESENPDCTFDFLIVYDGFSASLLEDEDVDLNHYIVAYKEIFKFFQLMGNVFSFVGSDIKSKIDILEELSKSEKGEHFASLKRMIQHEMDENLLIKKDYVSGSRTLLRLHRGLEFLNLFLERVSELENRDKTSVAGHESYNNSLAKHHPWIIRKGATVAMYALPTRYDLLMKICGNNDSQVERALGILPKMLSASREVHSRTEKCYAEKDLHGLP